MRHILSLILILSAFSSDAQYSKSDVIEVPNLKANQIYNKSKEWFFISFKSAKSVIDVDVQNEKLMGKGIATISYTQKSGKYVVPVNIPFDINISIDIKDGKFRYKIDTKLEYYDESTALERSNTIVDSVLKATPGSSLLGKKMREDMKENTRLGIVEKARQIKENIESLERSLKKHINSTTDNW